MSGDWRAGQRDRSPLRERSPPLEVWHRSQKSFSTSNLFQPPIPTAPGTHVGGTPSCQALKHAVSTLYRIDDFYRHKIGAGFFSEVFKVVHKSTGKIMVLKMNKHRANRNNMLKEVQLMNKLNHANILRFEAACVHEGQLHALTEFINGGSLEQLIQMREEDLTWSVRIGLALDIAKGLTYLHSKGIFHRDLTSKNVLIKRTSSGEGLSSSSDQLIAIVGDFGLAAKIPKSTDYRLPQVGSPYWMSPECLRGKFYDEKTDIFSYGIINCELIGRLDADPDVLPRTENFGVDYIAFSAMCPNCPPEYLKLTFSCVKIDPQSRPSAKDLVQDMTSLVASQKTKETQSCPRSFVFSHPEGKVTLRKVGHKRSLSAEEEQVIRRNGSPSEKARFHYRTHFLAPPTPTVMSVGKEMSLRDPHYRPSMLNPFSTLPRLREGRKILGSSQNLFSSCFELPSPSRANTPSGAGSGDLVSSPDLWIPSAGPTSRPVHSLPSSPSASSESVLDFNNAMMPNHFRAYASNPPLHEQCHFNSEDSTSSSGVRSPRSSSSSHRGRIPPSASASRFEDHLFEGRVQLLRRLYSGGNWMTQDDTAIDVNSASHVSNYGYPLRRRGSCESGFCSVGTDDLFMDSALSSTRSLGSSLLTVSDLEEDLRAASAYLKRTSSVFTDSTDDLASLTFNGEQDCSSVIHPGYEKDIRDIVEYFEATCRIDVDHHLQLRRHNLHHHHHLHHRRGNKSILARSGVAQTGYRGASDMVWRGQFNPNGCSNSSAISTEEGRGDVQLPRSQKIDSLIKRVVEKESRGRLRHKLPTPQRLQVCDGIVRSKLPLFDHTKGQARGGLPQEQHGIVKSKLAIFDKPNHASHSNSSSSSSCSTIVTTMSSNVLGIPNGSTSSKKVAERRLAAIMGSNSNNSNNTILGHSGSGQTSKPTDS
eukprot:TCALIF_00693-PA protein Name:"Similar to TESK2 Dual specificity testis-specific protein kinase 2 (Homo sapiens)" AED:0.06 eAED:0.06 QI:0/0.85/0.75/1/0.57/0.62/8/591/927